jgi:hypothetical protein
MNLKKIELKFDLEEDKIAGKFTSYSFPEFNSPANGKL